MISKQAVEDQLKRIGCNFRFWGRSEVNELGRIMMEDEVIAQCVNGEYGNGFAMLVATNHRLLLVDKKPLLYLTVEDYRYEMITEFNYSRRLLNATAKIHTARKTTTFTSWSQHRLRSLIEYAQGRVLEMRQQTHLASQFAAAAASQYAQLAAANQSMQYVPAYQAPAAIPQPSEAQPIVAPVAPGGQLPPAPAAPSIPSPAASPQQRLASRFANGRAALGTYTRSKLPNFHRHRRHATGAESGEVLPEGYRTQTRLGDFQMPYEFEG